MSWLFSQALVEEYLPDICLAGAPSAPSSGTPTPQAYLWHDKTTASWRRSPSGMTSAPLTDDRGEAVLTSFLAAFPARTSAAPERAQASPESAADFGGKWRESSVRYDRATSSWRTHRCLFPEVLPSSSVTLPRWGMMRDGVCWERTTSERHTSATASGLWQTPVADDAVNRVNGKMNSRGEPKLSAQVLRWPTPVASDGKKDPSGSLSRAVRPDLPFSFRKDQRDKVWPTPTAHNGLDGGSNSRAACAKAGLDAPSAGSLNPTWVEWLMGWPLGWTDCAASATDKYQRWQQQHGEFLEGANEQAPILNV